MLHSSNNLYLSNHHVNCINCYVSDLCRQYQKRTTNSTDLDFLMNYKQLHQHDNGNSIEQNRQNINCNIPQNRKHKKAYFANRVYTQQLQKVLIKTQITGKQKDKILNKTKRKKTSSSKNIILILSQLKKFKCKNKSFVN